jgi:hypothetical protein
MVRGDLVEVRVLRPHRVVPAGVGLVDRRAGEWLGVRYQPGARRLPAPGRHLLGDRRGEAGGSQPVRGRGVAQDEQIAAGPVLQNVEPAVEQALRRISIAMVGTLVTARAAGPPT